LFAGHQTDRKSMRKFSSSGIVKHSGSKFLTFLPNGERKLALRLTKCVSEG
jgi:hypothetical protein